jgi:hypothetical protein
MTSKTFEVNVRGRGTWTVEFPDTDWFTKEWVEEWKSYFYPYDELKQYAEHITYLIGVLGERSFAEGYGPVTYAITGEIVVSIMNAMGDIVGKAMVSNIEIEEECIDFETSEL